MNSYTLEELAEITGGEVLGDKGVRIVGVAGIREAGEGDITFLANPKYEPYLATTNASAVVADHDGGGDTAIIKVPNPSLAFLKIVSLFAENPFDKYPRGTHPTAMVHESSKIGKDVSIGPYVVVGKNVVIGDRSTILPLTCIFDDVKIGDDCLLFSSVVIKDRCEIHNRVIIHSGAVVGSDGFGYAKEGSNHQKIPQIGIVRLEDDVEIGANTTIDRATTGVTLIKRGTKIDNLVQIAHNVVVGEDSVLAAQVGVSGSTELGNNVTLAGQAGLIGHIRIGDGAMVGAQGGVTKSIDPGMRVSGYPAREHNYARKIYAASTRLPEMLKELRELRKRVMELERKGRGVDQAAEDD